MVVQYPTAGQWESHHFCIFTCNFKFLLFLTPFQFYLQDTATPSTISPPTLVEWSHSRPFGGRRGGTFSLRRLALADKLSRRPAAQKRIIYYLWLNQERKRWERLKQELFWLALMQVQIWRMDLVRGGRFFCQVLIKKSLTSENYT
jgi:hypothetical protein